MSAMTTEQQALAEKYYRLACKEALKHHYKTGIPLDECISESLFTLCRVAAWFDPQRQKPFALIVSKCIRRHLFAFSGKRLRRPEVAFSTFEKDRGESFDPVQPPCSSPDFTDHDLLGKLRRRVSALDWAILYRHYCCGEKFDAIGSQMGVSGESIRQRCRTTISRLRRSCLVTQLED